MPLKNDKDQILGYQDLYVYDGVLDERNVEQFSTDIDILELRLQHKIKQYVAPYALTSAEGLSYIFDNEAERFETETLTHPCQFINGEQSGLLYGIAHTQIITLFKNELHNYCRKNFDGFSGRMTYETITLLQNNVYEQVMKETGYSIADNHIDLSNVFIYKTQMNQKLFSGIFVINMKFFQKCL